TSEQGSDAYDNEKPVHSVTLSDFYIGKYEVTQSQWESVMGTTVEQHRAWAEAERLYDGYYSLVGVGPEYPMYYVSRNEAVAFCSKLSERTGKKYRLPTEAEWEYAARGGHHHDGTMYAGSDTAGGVAWYKGNSVRSTHPVGLKKPNGSSIYDMSGNVNEWCSDWYDTAYYGVSPVHNPQGAAEGTLRVARGGDYQSYEKEIRVSLRNAYNPRHRMDLVGFRVVCEL
ncbi:MAG: formylglycine-generating enzyme family protein, partial [Bacteroidales bacterium]|nr:formylglycine-generating enzyme family protein [Bacteroidales bacterium]